MSAQERTGWRDEAISGRHRSWGFNCPAVDLDFLVVEYNLGLPSAIVEYKHWQTSGWNTQHPTYRALTDLANGYRGIGLPALVVKYWPDIWAFQTFPLNEAAKEFFSHGQMLTERQYVKKLYKIRGRTLQSGLADLMDVLPEVPA